MRAPSGAAAAAAAAAAGKNESERESALESERETGGARKTRRGEAAGGGGSAREHEGARGPQPLSPCAHCRCRTREGASPARQVCAASAGRARGASAGLLKREHLGAHPPTPHLHRRKAGCSQSAPPPRHTRPAVFPLPPRPTGALSWKPPSLPPPPLRVSAQLLEDVWGPS